MRVPPWQAVQQIRGQSGGGWPVAGGGPGLSAVPGLSPGLKPCPMVLVFGCRQSRIDHIYKEETLFAKAQGVFRELYTAYSREPDKPKVGHAGSLARGHSSLGHPNGRDCPFPVATVPRACPHPSAS